MAVRLRDDLDQLPGPATACTDRSPIMLANNELAVEPLPSVAEAIRLAASSVNRYPDIGADMVVERLARRMGVPADHVVVGPGSATLLHQLVQATTVTGEDVLFAWRSFEAYPVIAGIVGVRASTVPLTSDGRHDLPAMAAAVTATTRLVVVCNPNNPTGTVVDEAAIMGFLDAVPDDVLVVLDEAYHEFASGVDGVALLRRTRRNNVAVLRTFSKAYGLAGLRIGYCVAPERVATALRKVCLPFAVGSLAQVAALACMDVAEEQLLRCKEVAAERDRVTAELVAAGYRVPRSQANFLWLALGGRSSAFHQHCRRDGIMVRCFPAEGVRVTVGTVEQNDAVLAAARSFAQERPA